MRAFRLVSQFQHWKRMAEALGRLDASKVHFEHVTDDGRVAGQEVRAGLARNGQATPITVIGRGDLVDRYIAAFSVCGVTVRSAEPGMARRGLFEIAHRAGLVA